MAEVDLSEIERYLRIFQENPDSRVFAPLADMYRRLGRLREAESICREGLLRHPYYAGGKVALAHILLEADRLEESFREAEAVVTYYPDNLLARKILVRALGGMNRLEEARREYEALKHLAPLVAGDPDLEQALQGRSRSAALPERPQETRHGSILRDSIVQPIEIQERTDWDPSAAELTIGSASAPPRLRPVMPPPAPPPELPTMPPLPQDRVSRTSLALLRSQKLSVLLRKKLILEALIQKLGAPERIG